MHHLTLRPVYVLACVGSLAAQARTADYVVIVNKNNSEDSITRAKLVRIFKAEVQEWGDKNSITLVLPKAGSLEKNVLLKRVYEMDEAELKRYWTTLIYQSRIAEQPRALPSSAVALKLVGKTRGAIAVIPRADFVASENPEVKVLAIDDKKAGDPDYWLNDNKLSVEPGDDPVDDCKSGLRDAAFSSSEHPARSQQEPKLTLEQRVESLEAQLAERSESATDEGDTPRLSIRGFGQVEFGVEHTNPDVGSSSAENAFSLGGLDLFLTSRLSPRISFLSETVFESNDQNETAVDVERLIIKYRASDALNIQAGRFHTTLGWWNETYHHGEWLQTGIGRPDVLRFEDDGGILPVHLVGLVVKGRHDFDACAIDYTLEVGNGRGPVPDPPQVVNDANDSKAVNVALKLSPAGARGLSFGGALYVDHIPPNLDAAAGSVHGSLDETIANAFVVWHPGAWETVFEYFAIHHSGGGGTDSNGWYAQVARRMGEWTPYLRLDGRMIGDGDPYYSDLSDLKTCSVGVRWDISTWNAIKLQGSWTDVHAAGAGVDAQRSAVSMQTSFSF